MTVNPAADMNMHWSALEAWWCGMAARLAVLDRAQAFFTAVQAGNHFDRIAQVGAQADYVRFVLMRYWGPTVRPPTSRPWLRRIIALCCPRSRTSRSRSSRSRAMPS